MEKIIMGSVFLLAAMFCAWRGRVLYLRAKVRGERVGLACWVFCFIAGILVFRVFWEVAPATVFGLFFGGVGLLLFQINRFFKRAIIVPGVVTGYQEKEDIKWKKFQERAAFHGMNLPEKRPELSSGPRPTYAPIVQFEFDGETRRITGSVYSSRKPEIGKAVKVGVNPQNIQDARVYQPSNSVLAWVFLAVGLVLFAAALYGHITVGILSPR